MPLTPRTLLTNVGGIYGPQMAEYVCCHILMHERRSLERFVSQQQKRWDTRAPGQLRNKSIGILGVGSIGKAIARAAKFFQMTTKGYTRSPITCEYIDGGYTKGDDLAAFVQNLDYLVSTLPDTAAIGFPIDIAPVFMENFQRFQSGAPLKYCVDFNKGY